MPQPLPHTSLSTPRLNLRPLAFLLVAAFLAHGCAWAAVSHLLGSPTAYAFQSSDSAEYVALARGLAWQGRYIQLDSQGHVLTGPDTWRTPGYPLFLALVVRLAGDSPLILLLVQQLVAITAVPLLWLVLRRLTTPRWAILAATAWCLDPFRIFYSLWLMSETFFAFVLLLACWMWIRKSSAIRGHFTLGLLTGLLVLIRPIAVPLPIIVLVGVAVAERRATWRKWLPLNLACLLGLTLALAPWLLRNRIVAGHFALSQQSGASLAYHKVVDVVLWSEHRPQYRFDSAATSEIRDRIDARLRREWPDVHGYISPDQLSTLTWHNLNYGKPIAVDPFDASSMLWAIGLDMLADRPWPMIECFAVQGLFMLIFPVGLFLWPPAGVGSAPLSMILRCRPELAAILRPVLFALGVAYALIILWIIVRLIAAAIHRRRPAGFFVFWPALAMFIFSLPFEDPRFRLPLIPLFLILAVAGPRSEKPPCPRD